VISILLVLIDTALLHRGRNYRAQYAETGCATFGLLALVIGHLNIRGAASKNQEQECARKNALNHFLPLQPSRDSGSFATSPDVVK
jgi:hypothetical protein